MHKLKPSKPRLDSQSLKVAHRGLNLTHSDQNQLQDAQILEIQRTKSLHRDQNSTCRGPKPALSDPKSTPRGPKITSYIDSQI